MSSSNSRLPRLGNPQIEVLEAARDGYLVCYSPEDYYLMHFSGFRKCTKIAANLINRYADWFYEKPRKFSPGVDIRLTEEGEQVLRQLSETQRSET